jgi:hypothetical protein
MAKGPGRTWLIAGQVFSKRRIPRLGVRAAHPASASGRQALAQERGAF